MKKSERFSTGGMFGGVLGIVTVAGVLVLGALESSGAFPAWGYPAGVLAIAIIWAVLMRPALVLGEREVELRNVFHSRWVPYAEITEVAVKQVTTIRTADEKYVASGFGRSRRNIRRDESKRMQERPADPSLGWLVEQKLQRRIDEAAYQTGEAGEVRRAWAWPEIVAVAGAAVATLVTALVAR